jgi:hypothetical protein
VVLLRIEGEFTAGPSGVSRRPHACFGHQRGSDYESEAFCGARRARGVDGVAPFHVRDGKVTRFVHYWDRERALADPVCPW